MSRNTVNRIKSKLGLKGKQAPGSMISHFNSMKKKSYKKTSETKTKSKMKHKSLSGVAFDALTRPFSRKVQLYSTPEYNQSQIDKKNPKSPKYEKNIIDKGFDRAVRGSKLLKGL